MLGRWERRVRTNAAPLALCGVLVALVALLHDTDRRLGLHEHPSTRFRFHAMPVAISVLYHNHPHDYTAVRSLAMRFQTTDHDIDGQLLAAARSREEHGGTYFWVADDRGSADFVIGAFRLFGPRVRSLSDFYILILGLSVLLYAAGFWRSPGALLLPVFVLLCWLAIAQVLLYPAPFPNAEGHWSERIPLYESRMFDVLALVAVLHLGVLAAGPVRGPTAWLTAIPQAALLVFLYHARSSLGWQYLGLFSLVAARVGWWVACRLRRLVGRTYLSAEAGRNACPPPLALARPLFVGSLLAASLVGLKQYQRAAYHPGYWHEQGRRTFWHNALMGLTYHPVLREELPMPGCEDRAAIDLVLKRMHEKDPNLDSYKWNWMAAVNSLGNHNGFDWNRYEKAARGIYLGLWKERPRDMAACYGYYKPAAAVGLAGLEVDRVATEAWAGRAWEFLAGLGLTLGALAVVVRVLRRDERARGELRALVRVAAGLVPFSLIPGIAFYPAVTTVTCFFLLLAAVGGPHAVRFAARGRVAA
jgi:hypothetical protein